MNPYDIEQLKKNPTRVVFASDWHVPQHDRRLFSLFLKAMADVKPDIIIMGGDVIDNYAVSKYEKDPDKLTNLDDDIAEVRKVLSAICHYCDRMIYLGGNHEARLRKYILRGAPQLLTLHAHDMRRLLELKALGIEYLEYGGVFWIGPMGFTHGDKVAKWSGHSVKSMSTDLMANLCIGHCHRQGVFYHTAGRRQLLGIEAGTMADKKLASDYMDRPPNWQQGFAFFEIGGSIHWELPHYDGNSFRLCGKIYGGKK